MKRIKLFENFLNESVSVKKIKPSKKDLEKLNTIKDSTEFVEEFSKLYNSAFEIWGNEDEFNSFCKKFKSLKYDFVTVNGETKDGENDSKFIKMLKDGWKVLASEQNYDSFEAILFKRKE